MNDESKRTELRGSVGSDGARDVNRIFHRETEICVGHAAKRRAIPRSSLASFHVLSLRHTFTSGRSTDAISPAPRWPEATIGAADGSRPSRERPSQSHRDRCAFIFQKSAARIAGLSLFELD